MARTDDPPEGTRFYARLLAAALECPRCGWLDDFSARKLNRRPINRRSTQPEDQPPGWDPTTASWRCGQCRKSFILGILAWPIAPGASRVTRPRDQVPNERQLAEMRARGTGIWLPEHRRQPRARAEDTNITARCCCGPPKLGALPWTGEPEVVDPGCPVHGLAGFGSGEIVGGGWETE